MSPEHAAEWLAKARRDLLSAERLAEGDPPFLDTAAYHAQQAAEKAIKAVLLRLGEEVPRIHDVAEFVRRVSLSLPEWEAYIPDAELLSPLATAYRYPFFDFEPEREDYEAAFRAAGRIFEAALDALPPEVREDLLKGE